VKKYIVFFRIWFVMWWWNWKNWPQSWP